MAAREKQTMIPLALTLNDVITLYNNEIWRNFQPSGSLGNLNLFYYSDIKQDILTKETHFPVFLRQD